MFGLSSKMYLLVLNPSTPLPAQKLRWVIAEGGSAGNLWRLRRPNFGGCFGVLGSPSTPGNRESDSVLIADAVAKFIVSQSDQRLGYQTLMLAEANVAVRYINLNTLSAKPLD
jgi:hypothetical protein